MIQTACTVVTRHEGRNIGGSNRIISVHDRGIGIEIIVGRATLLGHFRLRHLFVARGGLIGIVARRSRIVLGVILEIGNGLVEVVAVCFDHAAILTREGAAALGVGALTRREDGLLGLQEVVVLDKHAGTCGSSDTVLRTVVEVVVPYVDTHGAHTRMA